VTVRVYMPPVLRTVTGGKRELEAEGATLHDILVDLANKHPPLALHLFDEQGQVRRHILCIHASSAVRPCDFGLRRIESGDEITITNALAGG